jgi:hypothetical protein
MGHYKQYRVSVFAVLIFVTLVYIYMMQWHEKPSHKVLINEMLRYMRTGDIVLFKAYNNFYPPLMGTYYSHCGIVWINPDDPTRTPMCFEAASVKSTVLLPHHNPRGIFCTKVEDRIKKYPGACFIKKLNVEIPDDVARDFANLIKYAEQHMEYRYDIVTSAVQKLFGKPLDNYTNCGEIVYESLIKLGLLQLNQFDVPRAHHLKFVNNLLRIGPTPYGDAEYSEPIRLVHTPFNDDLIHWSNTG